MTPTSKVLFLKTDTRKAASEDEVEIFLGQPPSLDVTALTLDNPPDQMFASRDGRYVAYVVHGEDEGSELRVAKADDRPAFETIAESGDRITSVAWAPDAGLLTYFTSPLFSEEEPADGVERLHVVRPDGKEDRVIASFKVRTSPYDYRTLLGVDIATMNALWTTQTREGAGGSRGLTRTSLATGTSTDVGAGTGVVYGDGLALSPDMKKLYFVRGAGTLVERTLDDRTERTLYKVDTKRECAIESVVIDPSGEQLLFYTTPSPIVKGVCSSDPSKPQARTHELRIADLERSVVRAETGPDSLHPISWSPDGRFVWFGNFDVPQATALLDVRSGDFIPYLDEDEWASRWFLAWIAGSQS